MHETRSVLLTPKSLKPLEDVFHFHVLDLRVIVDTVVTIDRVIIVCRVAAVVVVCRVAAVVAVVDVVVDIVTVMVVVDIVTVIRGGVVVGVPQMRPSVININMRPFYLDRPLRYVMAAEITKIHTRFAWGPIFFDPEHHSIQ
jgi:hypothetical protein